MSFLFNKGKGNRATRIITTLKNPSESAMEYDALEYEDEESTSDLDIATKDVMEALKSENVEVVKSALKSFIKSVLKEKEEESNID